MRRLDRAARRAGLHASTAALRGRRRCRRAPTSISMDQRQKHWVQAMLNEDTYVPFPYFYDVTALEPAAALRRRRRLLGRAADDGAREAVGAVPRPGRAGAAGRRAVDRAVLDVADVHARHRVVGLAALAARPLGPATTTDVSAAEIAGRRARRRTTSCSCPTATPRAIRPSRATRTRSRTSGRPARPRSGAGCRAAAATSAGSTAPCSPRRSGSPRRQLDGRRAPRASPRRAR